MNRCLFVATDGSPAACAALLYALDFASAFHSDEIACLCVHEQNRPNELASASVVTAGDLAHSTGAPGPILYEVPDAQPQLLIHSDSVLDACRDQVIAAGFRFTPVIASRLPSHVIASTAHVGDMVFLGRNSRHAPDDAPRLGSTASSVLQSVQQTIVVCPSTYVPLERIVLLMAGDLCDAELVARGATWADALKVPALVAVADSGRPFSRNALEAAERVVSTSGVTATGTMYSCRPEEFARKLSPTDLILVARRRTWDLVHLWFGNATDRIVEHSAGPVAVMAKT